MAKLNLPAKAAGSYPCVLRQFLQLRPIRDECVARIFALRHSSEIDALGELKRYVLHAVNRKIDPAVQQRLVNFLRE